MESLEKLENLEDIELIFDTSIIIEDKSLELMKKCFMKKKKLINLSLQILYLNFFLFIQLFI